MGLLTAQQAAELLNLPPSWLLAEARLDRIPHCRFGKYVRFDAEDLTHWWRERARGPWRDRGAAAQQARTGSTAPRDTSLRPYSASRNGDGPAGGRAAREITPQQEGGSP